MRPIERQIEQIETETEIETTDKLRVEEKTYLQTLCTTIRNWQNRSLSHKHRLKGMELYEAMERISTAIPVLRAKQDHPVLEQLQTNLTNSLAGTETAYQALKQSKELLDQVTDLLYGQKDDKGNRNSEQYRKDTDAKCVKQKVQQILTQSHSHEQDKKTCEPMNTYFFHFEKTYANWAQNLFTCYDYPAIPNDNNRLELSHSQMKKEHRRTTGNSNTAKYLKIHGEQAAFTLHFGQQQNVQQAIIDIILQTDKEQFQKEKQKLKLQSQQRGKARATKGNLNKLIDEMTLNWGKIVDSS